VSFPAITKTSSLMGTVLAAAGAIDRDQLIAWAGVALAGLSALATFGWSQYHTWREARRKEDVADRKAAAEALREQIAAQVELEARLRNNAAKLTELEARLARTMPTEPRA